jgi:hypothetical protein
MRCEHFHKTVSPTGMVLYIEQCLQVATHTVPHPMPAGQRIPMCSGHAKEWGNEEAIVEVKTTEFIVPDIESTKGQEQN